jgi:HlyD family secretion protein
MTLRPGMTATATIAATERQAVLRVPNTAFSYSPATPDAAPAGARPTAGGGSFVSALMPRPPGGTQVKRAKPAGGVAVTNGSSAGSQRRVWVLQEGSARPIAVIAGLSNGKLTEVSGSELQEGMQVIVDQQGGAAR